MALGFRETTVVSSAMCVSMTDRSETQSDRRSVRRGCSWPGRAFEAPHAGSCRRFSVQHAEVLRNQFQETANHRRWWLLCAAVMATHVHLVVGIPGDPSPDNLLRDFKSYGSRSLNKHFGKLTSGTWWTESGSRRKLPTAEAVIGGIRYMIGQQSSRLIRADDLPEVGIQTWSNRLSVRRPKRRRNTSGG